MPQVSSFSRSGMPRISSFSSQSSWPSSQTHRFLTPYFLSKREIGRLFNAFDEFKKKV